MSADVSIKAEANVTSSGTESQLHFGCKPLEPFITVCCDLPFKEECTGKKWKMPGVYMEEAFAPGLQFNATEYGHFGTLPDGESEWTGAAKDLQKRIIDISLPTDLTLEKFLYFDFVLPFVGWDPAGFQVHLLPQHPFDIEPFDPFPMELWILWLASITFLALIVALMIRPNSFSCFVRNFCDALYNVLFLKGEHHMWNSNAKRILIIVWSFASGWVGLILYSAVFFENLSPDLRVANPFKTIEELATLIDETDYYIASRIYSPEYIDIKNGTEPIFEPLRNVIRRTPEKLFATGPRISETVTYVINNPGAIHPLGVVPGRYYADYHPNLVTIEDPVSSPFKHAFILPKNSSLTKTISRLLYNLNEFGIIHKLLRKYGVDVHRVYKKKSSIRPLMFSQVVFIVKWFCFCQTFAFVNFVGEVLLSEFLRRYRAYLCHAHFFV